MVGSQAAASNQPTPTRPAITAIHWITVKIGHHHDPRVGSGVLARARSSSSGRAPSERSASRRSSLLQISDKPDDAASAKPRTASESRASAAELSCGMLVR